MSARYDSRMHASLVAVAVTGAVLTFSGLAFSGIASALSIGLGAALATGNLWLLARIVVELLPDERAPTSGAGQSKAAWALVALLKMLGLLAAAWLLMRHGIVSPVPMLIGFGSLPIGIAIGSLVSDRGAA